MHLYSYFVGIYPKNKKCRLKKVFFFIIFIYLNKITLYLYDSFLAF